MQQRERPLVHLGLNLLQCGDKVGPERGAIVALIK
jgi:hypothetical protein